MSIDRVNRMLGSVGAPLELILVVDMAETPFVECEGVPGEPVSLGSTCPRRTSGARYPNEPAAWLTVC